MKPAGNCIKRGGGDKYTEQAFEFAERSRALLLRLSANNIMIDASLSAPDTTVKENEDLYWRKRIGSLNAQYLNSGRKNDSLLTLLSTSLETYHRYQHRLLQSGDETMRRKYNLNPAAISNIQNQLRHSNHALLQYAVTDRSIFVFTLNRDRFSMHRIQPDVLKQVHVLKQLYNLSPEKFNAAAYQLYRELIHPVEKHFVSDNLVIIPDGDLFYLNFEILRPDSVVQDFSKMKYLIHRYEISYQLMATSLIAAGNREGGNRKALLFTPVFTNAMKEAYMASVKNSSQADLQYFSLMRQPFAVRAAKQIGEYIPNDLFAEQSAVESAFKASAADYNILHLGTHAQVNNTAPLQSRFFLAKQLNTDTVSNDDGYLHAYEIYAMNLNANLAVLTACETGVGKWNQGAGVMSLAHSFIYAGCPSVIMSLWKIDEKTSADIVAAFYKHLSGGTSKSAALRLAKLNHLRMADKTLAHPYFWAGMTLVGSEDPLFETPLYTQWAWVAGLLLIAVVCWYFLLRKKP